MNPVDDLIVPAVVRAISELSGFRRVRAVERVVARQQRRAPATVPKRVRRGLRVDESVVAGLRVVTLIPDAAAEPVRDVVYLHGGAYVLEISSPQWSLAAFLARAVPARVHVVLYPLAPAITATHTVPAVADVLDGLAERHASPSLLGDSAGGGLGVAATQMLAAAGRRVPSRLVLLSPWLDVSLTNPAIAEVEGRDPLFTGTVWVTPGASTPATCPSTTHASAPSAVRWRPCRPQPCSPAPATSSGPTPATSRHAPKPSCTNVTARSTTTC